MEHNTGSFGSAIGGADAIKAAMQRRGMDASTLDQVSPAAPTAPSSVSPAMPQGGGMPQDMGGAPMEELPPMGTMETQKQQPRSAEMEIALKALADTVKTENKIAETLIGR